MILAAGQGSRLGHIGREMPKCMVPVLGRPMLESAFDSLAAVGVDEAVVVTGHLEELVWDYFGDSYAGVKITYVSNVDYARTNNIYSLWLARRFMDRDVLLLECDLVFDGELLSRLVNMPAPNVAVVDRYREFMDGTVILASPTGVAQSMVLKRDQGEDFDFSSALKTVNIYKFASDFLNHTFIPELSAAIRSRRTGHYYESVLAELIRDHGVDLGVLTVDDLRWAEVDTQDDLEFAWEVFGQPAGLRAAGR